MLACRCWILGVPSLCLIIHWLGDPVLPAAAAAAAAAASRQSCPTLCYSIDGGPPDSPIPGIPGKNTGVD